MAPSPRSPLVPRLCPASLACHRPGAGQLGLFPGVPAVLPPAEISRGRITRTGNALVRRLLIETAWHYQHRPSVGVALTRRRKGQPARVIAIADRAQQRLCRRFRKLAAELDGDGGGGPTGRILVGLDPAMQVHDHGVALAADDIAIQISGRPSGRVQPVNLILDRCFVHWKRWSFGSHFTALF